MSDVTRLLEAAERGEFGADEQLLKLVYAELHRMAEQKLSGDAAGQTLQPTALVPINEWSYIGYDQRHIGPMAQDFHEQFPLNENDQALNDADLHGVALAAIQGLNDKLEGRSEQAEVSIRKLEEENAALKGELAELKEMVRTMNHKLIGGEK